MKKHKIGWLNVPGYSPETWNPIVGCSKISTGCENCYAEKMAGRLANIAIAREMESGFDVPPDGISAYISTLFWDEKNYSTGWNGTTHLVESALEKPLRWKKPRAIFINSMGDLFHEDTPARWIVAVFEIIKQCPQHIFIVLTKRADRMSVIMQKHFEIALPNVWLGVTAENQEQADKRIPYLIDTPAVCRFVSIEPMIGAVDIGACMFTVWPGTPANAPGVLSNDLDWVICGGESGSGARAMNPAWARNLRDQCAEAGVPFFFKQWGRTVGGYRVVPGNRCDTLDGRKHHEFPSIGKSEAGGTPAVRKTNNE